MGRRRVIVLAGALLLGLVPAARADETTPAPGAALVEICVESGIGEVPEVGPRTCKSFDSGSVLFAMVCGQLPLPPEACAQLTDGRVIDPALVDQFEQSWTYRALRLQDRLDDGVPLRLGLIPHTHNSSNSTAYAPSLSNLDPNQRYSIGDQLRMGIRGIELDLHWVPHPSGTAESGGKAVVLCHGRSESAGGVTVHLGCSVDRRFEEGLAEIRSFLDAPDNERELVLLYLENQLDGDPVAHAAAAAAIEEVLGDLVARPPAGQPCAPMPLDATPADLLGAGKQVLIVGNCGPAGWGTWVHERGPLWDERGNSTGYPAFETGCEAERAERRYDERFIRVWEDSTWLSAMVGGGSTVTADDLVNMVRCGVNLPGVDRLEPFDGRMDAFVWSWAPGEPVQDPAKGCAAWGTDARFRAEACNETRGYACRAADGGWVVPAKRGPAERAAKTCAKAGATPDTPDSGWDNEQLRVAAAGAGELWLDYRDF